MVDIISRGDGPRREDVVARRMISENRGKITHIADRLTQGAYSAGLRAKAAPAAPAPERRLIHAVSTGRAVQAEPGDIRVKISVNNRVLAYDSGNGRQVHLLGELRWQQGVRYFALASTANGFLADLPDAISGPIAELDGQIIDAACPESLLATEISQRLGYS